MLNALAPHAADELRMKFVRFNRVYAAIVMILSQRTPAPLT